MEIDKKAIVEGAKELGRVVLIAMIPVFYTSINMQTGEFTFNWKIMLATGLVALLKAVDKYVHEEPNTKSSGILPF